MQDNGPGIVKKQIPLIFGKLLYGSKFHRLRMSRGQQGIGISAAGMYGVLTTGKPVKIISKSRAKKPAHYYEIQIDTKKNEPRDPQRQGRRRRHSARREERRSASRSTASNGSISRPRHAGDDRARRRSIVRGRGSVDEYLEQTAIANPHVALHYNDPEGNERHFDRSTDQLPPEPKEIKPHPYGVELGRLVTMLKDTTGRHDCRSFSRSRFRASAPAWPARFARRPRLSTRASTRRDRPATKPTRSIRRSSRRKIASPATDCISPIGEELILKGLHQVVPGEFYAAATRPPAVYRGNPFQIEVGAGLRRRADGAAASRSKCCAELLDESDARTLRQFLINTFNGLGSDAADKILKEAELGTRQSPGQLKKDEIAKLHAAMQSVNLDEGQTMNVLRYANRVPLQFSARPPARSRRRSWAPTGGATACTQSRGALPSGPVTVMVHMASVWVPFTSESKEAIAGYPEIQKELRLALQAVGRKLGMYLRRRLKVKQEGERRNIFLRYLGEVATAVSDINQRRSRGTVRTSCCSVAKKKTAEADMKLDDQRQADRRGRRRRLRRQRADRRSDRRRRHGNATDNRATAATVESKSIDQAQSRIVRHRHGQTLIAKSPRVATAPAVASPSLRHATRRRSASSSTWPTASSTAAEKRRDPHLDIPTRTLSNVNYNRVEAVHRDGQRHEPPAAVQPVAGQELHADAARGQRLQAADRRKARRPASEVCSTCSSTRSKAPRKKRSTTRTNATR